MKDFISICVCTFKRTEMLTNLLAALRNQLTENLFTYSIIVVDNDKTRSAEKVVADFKINSLIETTYVVEERQNISLARNRAINHTRGDLIAFIDDDEIPKERWLLTLYKAMKKFQADAVMGPVFPMYRVQPPAWVINGKFHWRPTHKTGTLIDWRMGRTGNLLIKKHLFDSTGIYFDPKFGQGGEDQDLTRRMLKKGFKFIWCNEADVHEIITPSRWNLKSMLKKAIIRGKMSSHYPGSKTLMLIKSSLAVLIYLLALPFLLIIGYHLFVEYLIKMFDHIGRINAILNLHFI